MPSFDFSIKIVGQAGQAAQFVPQGGQPGGTLTVKAGDIVSWGNDTEEVHQPWPTNAQHVIPPGPPVPLLTNEIPAQQSSSPAWVVTGSAGTLYYRCKTHPNRKEFGTITITT
jgi:plastocyanin